MKITKEKISNILSKIYGIGITFAFFVGAFSFFGYLIAIVIGGSIAGEICTFIHNKVYPIIFYISSISVIIGMLKMYIAGEKSFSTKKEDK